MEQSSEAQTPLKPAIREAEAEATQDSFEHTQISPPTLALPSFSPSLLSSRQQLAHKESNLEPIVKLENTEHESWWSRRSQNGYNDDCVGQS